MGQLSYIICCNISSFHDSIISPTFSFLITSGMFRHMKYCLFPFIYLKTFLLVLFFLQTFSLGLLHSCPGFHFTVTQVRILVFLVFLQQFFLEMASSEVQRARQWVLRPLVSNYLQTTFKIYFFLGVDFRLKAMFSY